MKNDFEQIIKPNNSVYTKYIKRFLDLIFSSMAIILLSPVFLITAILVKIKLGSPVIYKQQRPGLNEQIFIMYKFRSMTNDKDEFGVLLPNKERLTKFGKILRSSSLDELPELFNIFRGDMSIIGPRPLKIQYLPLYNDKQRHRHDVRPGLSGMAQVNGRNAITWKEKFDFDIYYIENVSLILDLKIALQTFSKVFKKEGVSKSKDVIMEKFTGTEN